MLLISELLTMHKETKSLLKWPEVSPFKSLSNDFPYTERKNYTSKYKQVPQNFGLWWQIWYTWKFHQRTTAPNIKRIINIHFTNSFSDNYDSKCGVQCDIIHFHTLFLQLNTVSSGVLLLSMKGSDNMMFMQNFIKIYSWVQKLTSGQTHTHHTTSI